MIIFKKMNEFLKKETYKGGEIYEVDGIEYMRYKLSIGFLSLIDVEGFADRVISLQKESNIKFAYYLKEEKNSTFTTEDSLNQANKLLLELDFFFLKNYVIILLICMRKIMNQLLMMFRKIKLKLRNFS